MPLDRGIRAKCQVVMNVLCRRCQTSSEVSVFKLPSPMHQVSLDAIAMLSCILFNMLSMEHSMSPMHTKFASPKCTHRDISTPFPNVASITCCSFSSKDSTGQRGDYQPFSRSPYQNSQVTSVPKDRPNLNISSQIAAPLRSSTYGEP